MNKQQKIRIGIVAVVIAVAVYLLWPRNGAQTVVRKRKSNLPGFQAAGFNVNLPGFTIPALPSFGGLVAKGCGCYSCGRNRSVQVGGFTGFDAADMPRLADYRPAGSALNVTRVYR